MSKYYVDAIPTWMIDTSVEEYDKDFIKIIDFFQFHSPVPGQSARCKTLAEYGWIDPWKKPYWLNKQLRQMSSNYDLLFTAKSGGEMEENLERADLIDAFPNDLGRERICVADNKNNQFMSVFYHIRDAFAHGRFYITEFENHKTFVMEDVTPGLGKKPVSARMIIRKDTLLAWISLIENGEKLYTKIKV